MTCIDIRPREQIHLDPETESSAVHAGFSKTLEAVLCREIWSHRGNPNV